MGSRHITLAGGGGDTSLIIEDTFTDGDGTLLSAHTPDVAPFGAAWRAEGSYEIEWIITSNKADPVTDSDADQVMLIDAGVRDVVIEADVTGESASVFGMYFAFDNAAGEYTYMWWSDQTNVFLAEVDSGGYTGRHSAALAWANGATKAVKVTIVGGTVNVFFDNVLILTSSAMDTENTNGTEHGIFAKLGAEVRFDNFTVHSQ
jgi:hypothetical protein